MTEQTKSERDVLELSGSVMMEGNTDIIMFAVFCIAMVVSNWRSYREGQDKGVELAYDMLARTASQVRNDGWLYARLHRVDSDGNAQGDHIE